MDISKMVREVHIKSESFARELADSIEKVVDTTPHSINRKDAKQELISLIIAMTHKDT